MVGKKKVVTKKRAAPQAQPEKKAPGNSRLNVEVKAVSKHKDKVMPGYKSNEAAAIDLHISSDRTTRILPNEVVTVGSGIAVHINNRNVAGVIIPRSSVGKRGVVLQNTVGLIDSDYQGEIQLMLRNTGQFVIELEPFERVAQMIFMPVVAANLVEVSDFTCTTERGEGGIGSTGK